MLGTWLKEANYTVVLTGAGMSTESGLPDFRSAAKGLWKYKDPQKLASVHALRYNQEEFFQFYQERIRGLLTAKPHQGHVILAKWEEKGLIKSIITQNVDGFHHQAGSRRVAELHGTLLNVHCQDCGKSYPNTTYLENQFYCSCGGVLRPSVVLFGESLPQEAVELAERESRQADLFIVLGSSLQVSPANYFPQMAKQMGAKLVIVNMEPTELDPLADLVIHQRKIGEVLAELDAELGHQI